jgi:acid phosphatase type 7
MRRRFSLLGAALLLALLVGPHVARADSATVTVAEDTYVSLGTPTTVHGRYAYLGANSGSHERRPFLKFTVGGIPTGATNVTARLELWAESSSGAVFTVRQVPPSWTESTLTWNNQPALASVVTTRSGVTGGRYNAFNVSGLVAGSGTWAMAITKSTATQVKFTSREAATNHPPRLVVSWTPPSAPPTTTTPPSSPDPVLAAAGDIACHPSKPVTATTCHHQATSDLLGGDVTAVQTLGDNQYDSGTLDEFNGSYDPTWGRVKARTHPAPGNHEYLTADAAGYHAYFGAAAGEPGKGYYSYDLGTWHIIVLNSEIPHGAGSTQEQWLRSDLAADRSACTLAAWHRARFSSGANHGSDASFQPFWQALYDDGADVVLVGHEHTYERFAPQTPNGTADPARGIRQFVVGTGGAAHHGFGVPLATSEVRNGDTYGVLKLTLQAGSYTWRFVPEAGGVFTDSGSGACQ